MDINPQDVTELLKLWEKTGIGRLSAIIAELSELGLNSIISPTDELDKQKLPVSSTDIPGYDPLLSPKKAAEYLDVTQKTLKYSWTKKFDIKSGGDRANRRYALSELNRVKTEIEKLKESTEVGC